MKLEIGKLYELRYLVDTPYGDTPEWGEGRYEGNQCGEYIFALIIPGNNYTTISMTEDGPDNIKEDVRELRPLIAEVKKRIKI